MGLLLRLVQFHLRGMVSGLFRGQSLQYVFCSRARLDQGFLVFGQLGFHSCKLCFDLSLRLFGLIQTLMRTCILQRLNDGGACFRGLIG